MIHDHFPYIYENGHWISTKGHEPSMLLLALKALFGSIGILALIWVVCVIIFLLDGGR